MLALRTGWTEETIADGITDDFRRACHHALYAEIVAGELTTLERQSAQLEAIDITQIPTAERAALRRGREAVTALVGILREQLEGPAEGPETVN